MNIRDLDKQWTAITMLREPLIAMYLKDFKMTKESGTITDVYLTNQYSKAMIFLSEERAREVAKKTGLSVRETSRGDE